MRSGTGTAGGLVVTGRGRRWWGCLALLASVAVVAVSAAAARAADPAAGLPTPSIIGGQDRTVVGAASINPVTLEDSTGTPISGATVTFNLYDNASASGTPLSTSTGVTNAAGQASSAPYVADEIGTYYWVASYDGDAHNGPVSSGTADEPLTVSPAATTLTGLSGPASATVGSPISVDATLQRIDPPIGPLSAQPVTFSLYDNSHGTGTPLFTGTATTNGNGVATLVYTPTAAGTFYWVATYNNGLPNYLASSTSPDGPVTISAVTPSITTSQQPAAAVVASAIADQATVSGGYKPSGTVAFSLYGNSSGSGAPLFTDTEPLSNGTATSAAYTPAAAGTDYWVATYNGDAGNNPVSSSQAGEPVAVSPATPVITTKANPTSAPVETDISDTATLTEPDGVPIGNENVTFTLYDNPSAKPQQAGQPPITFTGKTDTNGQVSVTAPASAVQVPGTYYWVASYSGDANNNPVSSGPADEPVTVNPKSPLTVSTSQQPATATVGSSIADQATVSGGYNPSGTVTFNLYGNSTGSGTPLFTDTESLTNGTAASAAYMTAAAGTDYWVATYNGDHYNPPLSSGSGAEPVNVTQATPSITTSQQPAAATVGSSIADQATVSAGYNPRGTVTFSLYGNATATGKALFTDTEGLSNGTATSKGYTATATGTDYWVVTYNGDANNNPVTSASGGEPVSITTASKLADVSVAISGPATATDNSSATEKITVKNTGPANAGNVLTTVLVPAGLTITNAGGGQTLGGLVFWTASQIPAGGQVTYTITVKVAAHAAGTVLIAAGAASLTNPDPNYANNVAAATVKLGQEGLQAHTARRLRNPLPATAALAGYLHNLTRHHGRVASRATRSHRRATHQR